MPPDPFVYAVIKVVPRVERGECVNIGVVLFCRPRRVLDGRFELNHDRLRALAPELDLEPVERQVAVMQGVLAGRPEAGAMARLSQAERFGWLVSPASTVVQPGPVHAGVTSDPVTTLERLFATLVRVSAPRS
jgi:hypothetical protein